MPDDNPNPERYKGVDLAKLPNPDRDEHGRYLPAHSLGGRPLRVTDDAIERICDLVASGYSLAEACESSPYLPAVKTLYQWLAPSGDRNDEEISSRLRKHLDLAREQWADTLAHSYIRTVQDAPHDKDEAAWLRELGAAVRWKTAMLAPSRYGRRVGDAGDIALTVGVQVVLPGKDDDK